MLDGRGNRRTTASSIAEFTLPAAEFPLGRVFEDRPAVTLELDRVVPFADTVMPYFWVQDPDGDLAGIADAFADLPELREIVLMDEVGDRGLFRAEWQPEYIGIMGAIDATDLVVVSAAGSEAGWSFELRATDDGQFTAFQRICAENDVGVTLRRLRRLSESPTGVDYGLTSEQREALVLAYEEGYYDEPRGTNQETLASRLGITRQALSSRLRHGYRNLLERTVVRGHEYT